MTAIAVSAPARPLRRGWITASVMLATLLQVVDVTIAAVALPEMQGSLSATQDQISWVLTSYLVAAAIMTPSTGWLAGRFGRKRIFLISVGGFIAASLLCGQSSSLGELVGWRLFQGGFGAALVPLSQATLLDTYPRERHGMAMGIWSVGLMIGPIIGPTLGAWVTETYSWPWIFYINLPVGLLALLGLSAFLPPTERRHRPVDLLGFAALGLGIGSFQIMLDRGELLDWFSSTEIMIEAAVAAGGIYVFVTHALLARQPFLDLRLLKDRNLAVGVVMVFTFGMLLFTGLALLPPFLQNLLDYPVLTSGVVLVPRGGGAMVAMVLAARLLDRMDGRWLLFAGLMFVNASFWSMTQFTAEVSFWTLSWTGALQGFGLGWVYVPVNILTFSTLAAKHRTEAAGMFNLMRNIGSSIGISVVVSVLTRYTQLNHAEISSGLTPFNELLRAPYLPKAWSLGEFSSLAVLNREVTHQAATIAYLNDFKLLMIIGILAAPLILLFRPPRNGARAPAQPAE